MDLLIIQHASETKHAINTARIAGLGIKNCEILVGEDFSHSNTLKQKLANQHTCLLFPTQNAIPTQQFITEQSKPELCVIIDGTWRKAKRIYFVNPALQQLPAVALTNLPPSNYKIRKAPDPNALSTIEATVAFLREAGGDTHCHQNCLDAFERLIDFQIAAMGEETFLKNHVRNNHDLIKNEQ